MEYWIDGYFVSCWGKKTYYCPERDLDVPIKATLRIERNRIYIDPNFAKAMQLKRKTKILRGNDKNDLHLMALVKAINVPWEKEPYVEPEPRFRVSLP